MDNCLQNIPTRKPQSDNVSTNEQQNMAESTLLLLLVQAPH